ncbi:4-hydroxythreonine-4-phosphate dehydrogenase PdxA [Aestuariivirga sp.]|uniref:4-hydroxythreonine-4-phosphate dehydrogenase PdxA n=1 Tax=Aestuariivirga sp. TaxID=2650926 RepID=UPI0039E2AE74
MPTEPLVLTPGEPGGVGPEITAKAWAALHGDPSSCFYLIGDAGFLAARCAAAGIEVPARPIAAPQEAKQAFATALPVLHRPLTPAARTGAFDSATAPWVIAAIDEAVDHCFAGQASGMVTCPIQKEALYAAGFSHQGHTDYLASLATRRGHTVSEVMMLVGGGLRAIPVTVHIALKDVPRALTGEAIEAQARVTDQALRTFFGITVPRIAITGLNPHAGENGSMGREEIETIIPAIRRLQAEGLHVRGPLPADTAFFPQERATYDAILCMYHDQALIPVKTLDFHGGVNVTLGLPFIRTSPDHGTALGLAGTGKAHAESLIAAIRLARDMATNSAKTVS